MKRIFVSLLLIVLFLFTACGSNSFSIIMTEAYGQADSVTMMITMGGTTYSDLTFTINSTPYTVSDIPTVSDPTFGLTAAQEDSMEYVRLKMPIDDTAEISSDAALHMLPEDGTELVYTCSADELQPLLSWMAVN